jgi:flagellar protein FliT
MRSPADELSLYQEIHSISGRMVQAAQAAAWDELVVLEARMAALRDRLQAEASAALSTGENESKAQLIRAVLDDDVEVRRLIGLWMAEVRPFLASQNQHRKVQQAYAAGGVEPVDDMPCA